MLRHPRSLTKLLLPLLVVAMVGAGCGGDDDDSSSSKDSKTTTTVEDGGGDDGGGTTEDTAALSPEEARKEGNPETYARIEALEDCDALERERDAAKANAEKRKDNPRRVSILESYAEAAQDRMDELDCKG